MIHARTTISILLAAALGCASVPPKRDLHIEFCHISVPAGLRQGRASFSAYYGFEIDSNGKPTQIQRLREHPLGDDPFESCISKWVLKGMRDNKDARAHFRWTHGIGWEYLEVSCDGSSIRVELSGDCCPYP